MRFSLFFGLFLSALFFHSFFRSLPDYPGYDAFIEVDAEPCQFKFIQIQQYVMEFVVYFKFFLIEMIGKNQKEHLDHGTKNTERKQENKESFEEC